MASDLTVKVIMLCPRSSKEQEQVLRLSDAAKHEADVSLVLSWRTAPV